MKFLIGACAAALVTATAVAQPVKVGAIYPLTGSASFLGVPEERALRMKVDELNKAGGVNGHRIELTVYDTEGNPAKAAQQLRRLASSDNVDLVLGPSSSGETLQTMSIANELKVPQIAHGGAEAIVNPSTRYVFNSVPTDRVALQYVMSYFKKKNIKTLALMTSADGYGQSGRKIAEGIAADYGVKVVAAEEFNREDFDITAQVLKVRESGAAAVLVWSALPAPIVIARNAKAIGLDKPIFIGYGAASNDLATKGGPAADGLYVSSFRLLAPDSLAADDPVRPVVLEIYNKFKARYNDAPANFAQHSYDAALILEAALKGVSGPVTRESLRDAIEKVDVMGANGHFRFSPTNHGGLDSSSNPLVMVQLVKGKWQVVD